MLERLPDIGHIHAAGYPGRHELQIGDIAYEDVFAELRSAGYTDYVGLEYVPSIEHDLGLAYAKGLCNGFNT
ncbi:hypothetical protein ACFPES_20805 [Paenibacillus sp. GCM10023248]|uniref:hypothetical protein n=1 Tax=Bacillales TaxID=1385 RepID=UPI0023783B5C|nr:MULTISPECIES: hypothetical protein [Bacillales]MDD9269496.1 hypothetical protein [Paenibacillus sp. MAHUQ-63]